MRYKVTNISRDKINILGMIMKPRQEIITFDITPYRRMINEGFLTVETDNIELEQIKTNKDANITFGQVKPLENISEEDIIKEDKINIESIKRYSEEDKNKILDSLFHFYIDRKLTDDDLNNIKKFYTDIWVTSKVKDKTLINNATNYEELITILLNHIYPQLF